MYISRVPLNVARPNTLRLVASSYFVHAAVEHCFPPTARRLDEKGRVLWRIDANPKDKDSLWLYVVSPERPDFTHVADQYGWPAAAPGETKDYSPLLGKIAQGQSWQFRLKANPTRLVRTDKGKRPNEKVVGTIQGHATEAQQVDWLRRQGNVHGFELAVWEDAMPYVTVTQRRKERFSRQGSTVTISTAVFDGVLTVTDASAFARALCQGVGRSKSFGCGLLTIAPWNRR
ncbi:type I-E CRISPR-associated protein Cas6/Cse3/CasE [Olsenella massiliensis]|uniref:type I-E CRISPR-associated protein Cas6/Cse3/CasE n=1 Tax=Olsenella massiliensis TaxID=1622075 RepID=UPI0009E78583|nr:type I-E CRISPR-associated protein Cas6/Cse3/CasE [Olsenella massiliensis]